MTRRSKYDEKFPATLRAEMANGLSFEACCGILGVSKDTGYEWLKRYPEFAQAKAEGRALGQLYWERAAIGGLWSSGDSKFNSTVWIFTMKNQHGWTDKRELTGAGGVPLFAELTPGQVDAKLEELLGRMPAELITKVAATKRKPK